MNNIIECHTNAKSILTNFMSSEPSIAPAFLLPNHFSIVSESCKKISVQIEDCLISHNNIAFTSFGSYWSGIFLHISSYCDFKFCVYQSQTVEKLYIIEGQCIEGDNFLFGDLYQEIKSLFYEKKENYKNLLFQYDNNIIIDEIDSRGIAENIKSMIESKDSEIILHGIQIAGEMCEDVNMIKFMYNTDLVYKLFQVIENRNIIYLYNNKWECLYILLVFLYLANNDIIQFQKYITEKIIDDKNNLLSLLKKNLMTLIKE